MAAADLMQTPGYINPELAKVGIREYEAVTLNLAN
jgi:hypothetical protein